MLERVKRDEHGHDRRLLEPPTPGLEGRPPGQDLAGRAWEAIARAEQHMQKSAQRLERSQILLLSGAQRVQWIARRVDGNRARTRTVGPDAVGPDAVGPDTVDDPQG